MAHTPVLAAQSLQRVTVVAKAEGVAGPVEGVGEEAPVPIGADCNVSIWSTSNLPRQLPQPRQ